MEEESECIREGGARNCSVIWHCMLNMIPVAVADVACAIRMERKNGKSGINRWWGQQTSWVVRAGKKWWRDRPEAWVERMALTWAAGRELSSVGARGPIVDKAELCRK